MVPASLDTQDLDLDDEGPPDDMDDFGDSLPADDRRRGVDADHQMQGQRNGGGGDDDDDPMEGPGPSGSHSNGRASNRSQAGRTAEQTAAEPRTNREMPAGAAMAEADARTGGQQADGAEGKN